MFRGGAASRNLGILGVGKFLKQRKMGCFKNFQAVILGELRDDFPHTKKGGFLASSH